MPKNYLIGIGGTGARVIEAVVNLCAAGYGPEELSIFIVDPDAGNGNLTRTKNIITNYIKCRNGLERTEATEIFKTDIKIPPDEKGFVWEIFSDKNSTLASFINYENMKQSKPELSEFVNVLFSENELKTALDEGFRGHPSIGAVVMSNPDTNSYPFKMLWDDLSDRKPNDVRVFLVGSVFGGTGAAGFPTFGSKQILKQHPAAKIGEDKSKIVLGGALVLPYFTFELDNDTEEKMFVTANDFPLATKAALQYYNEKDLGFDEIYFIGDSLGQKVGKFAVGAKNQQNLPHYIELVSALAAFDFYREEQRKDIPERMLFTAKRENEVVSWESLPISRDAAKIRSEQKKLKDSLTKMAVFAFSYLTYGRKIREKNQKEVLESWYKDYFSFNDRDETNRDKDLKQASNKDVLDDFDKFLSNFIFWLAAMDDESGKVNLINKQMLVKGDLESSTSMKLYDPELETTLTNISQLIKGSKSEERDFNYFKKAGLDSIELKDRRITKASSKYLHLFYEGAKKYYQQNYRTL